MISKEEIQKMAELARLGISEEEANRLKTDAEEILDYVSQISKVEVEGVEEKKAGIPHNILREDKDPHSSGEYVDELISQAPDREQEWVRVKKILED